MGALAVGRLNAAELDAVTIDAYGTLVELDEPVARLRSALRELGDEVDAAVVAAALDAAMSSEASTSSSWCLSSAPVAIGLIGTTVAPASQVP